MSPEGDPSRRRTAARGRDARAYTRLPVRVNGALAPVAAAAGGMVAGWPGVVGGAIGVGLVLLIFGGGGVASAFAGRGTGGRLLAVTLAGLFTRLLAVVVVLRLLARTGVAHGPSVAVAAMLAILGTLTAYLWASERNRRAPARSSRGRKGAGR